MIGKRSVLSCKNQEPCLDTVGLIAGVAKDLRHVLDQWAIAGTVPWFVQGKPLVKRFLFEKRQQVDTPAQKRFAFRVKPTRVVADGELSMDILIVLHRQHEFLELLHPHGFRA